MKRDNFFKLAWCRMKGIVYCFVLVVLVAACSDDLLDSDTNVPAVAFVSFYHASPDAPGLSVTVDDRSVFSEIEYSEYSGYLNFYVGERNFKVNPLNASNSLVDTTFTFDLSKSYSVFFIDALSGMEALLTQDTADVPAAGKAMVRFVHLSPDAQALDINFNDQAGDPLFSGQSFKEGSPFKEISAGSNAFEVKSSGSDNTLLSVDDLNLKAGRYYTIITRGYTNPPQGNTNTLSVQVVEN
jgi:hypothetical protein